MALFILPCLIYRIYIPHNCAFLHFITIIDHDNDIVAAVGSRMLPPYSARDWVSAPVFNWSIADCAHTIILFLWFKTMSEFALGPFWGCWRSDFAISGDAAMMHRKRNSALRVIISEVITILFAELMWLVWIIEWVATHPSPPYSTPINRTKT